MPRCAPCTTFADRGELPATQIDRKWSSRAEMIASARSGCDLCTLCWQHAASVRSDEDFLNEPIRLCPFSAKSPFGPGISVPFLLKRGTQGAGVYVRECDPQDNPSSLMVDEDPISQAQQCLAKCLSSHGECGKIDDSGLHGRLQVHKGAVGRSKANQSLPRRLLDLSKGSDILVIDVWAYVDDGTLTPTELSQYCTLSYRWGVTAHSCILKAPFTRQISFDIENMPQTFRDGIEATRGLGIRFLWIDALCIVQPGLYSDDSDWAAEGTRMGIIYHNAICTIAATCADSVADGFLSKTDSKRIRAVPCEVMQYMGDGQWRPCFLKPMGFAFDRTITSSALNKRGWVTQERLLSRRILHFTIQGVIWECRNGKEHGDNAVEDSYYDSIPWDVRSSDFGKDREKNEWMQLVERYSRTEFTNPEDRLVALSSLARVVHHYFGHDDAYCAGLWRSRLTKELMWMRLDEPNSETPQRLKIAPTWSWASIDGEIQPWICYPSTPVQLLDVHLVPAQYGNPYGNVKAGRIRLLTQVFKVSLGTRNARPRGRSSAQRFVYVNWDEWQGDVKEEKEYKVVVLTLERIVGPYPYCAYEALIVEQVHDMNIEARENGHVRTYRRIGFLRDERCGEYAIGPISEAPIHDDDTSEQDMETLDLV